METYIVTLLYTAESDISTTIIDRVFNFYRTEVKCIAFKEEQQPYDNLRVLVIVYKSPVCINIFEMVVW